MSLFADTHKRSTQPEIMDDLSMEGEALRRTLDDIASINRMLGGNKATLSGIKTLMRPDWRNREISILDLGCGNGDMLRAIADLGRENKFTFKLTGVDANAYTIEYARQLSAAYPEISYRQENVLDPAFPGKEYDIVLATLFLHHFSDTEIIDLLKKMNGKTREGIIINDLHRCRRAYYLFWLISRFIPNPMVRYDGAMSILRGFKKDELTDFTEQLPGTHRIRWVWAFRYQWIINTR